MKKVCSICGIEKDVQDFNSNGYKKNGTKQYKPNCRDCNKKNKKEESKKEHIKEIPVKTQKEFIDLDKIVDKDTIISILTNRDNRVRTTFNLDVNIKEKLSEYCKKSKFNISDVVNLLFNRFFE